MTSDEYESENDDEWTEQDEFMRKHAPIRPPEVKKCSLCRLEAIAHCADCQNAICKVHLRKCSSCNAIVYVICVGEEYGTEIYCCDCLD